MPSAYEFSDIRIDLAGMTIFRAGVMVPVEPKAFDVLLLLIENRDRLVTKEELLEHVWNGTFVAPNALTRSIALLRRALGDDAHEARYVETLTKRGYRFIAPVRVVSEDEGPVVSPSDPKGGGARQGWWWAVVAVAVVMTAAMFVLLSIQREERIDTAPQRMPKLERVTTSLGYNGGPAISPDGRFVAYVSDRSGALEIYMTAFTPGGKELVITSDGGQNVEPAWSPDGQWLAYHSRVRKGIWIIPSTGGTARQVIDFGSQPAFSPDGKSLAFTADAEAMAYQSAIWTVRTDGSTARRLTSVADSSRSHRHPSWSQSGKWIVFARSTKVQEPGGVAMVSVATGDVVTILTSTGVAAPRLVDGDRAVVWASMTDWNTEVLRSRVNPTTLIGEGPVETVGRLMGIPHGLSVGNDGTIVIGVVTTDNNLWSIDVEEDGRTSDPRRLTSASIRNGYANYSTDGRIAFTEMSKWGQLISTWVMRDDGTGREPLVIDRTNGSPQWSNDGRVLVRHDPNPPEQRFWWVDPVTRKMTPTAISGRGIISSQLSPDGLEIAYHSLRNGVMNVWTRSLSGGPPRQITFDREGATYAIWAPDGRELAVELKRGESTQIALVPRNGGAYRVLTTGEGHNWPHSWSRDGRWIAFAGQRRGVWNLYAIAPDTREVRTLTRLTAVNGYVRYPSWSPDGRRIVFERTIVTGGVWALRK